MIQSSEYREATDEVKREMLKDAKEAGGRDLSKLTTYNPEYKEAATEGERRLQLERYLNEGAHKRNNSMEGDDMSLIQLIVVIVVHRAGSLAHKRVFPTPTTLENHLKRGGAHSVRPVDIECGGAPRAAAMQPLTR